MTGPLPFTDTNRVGRPFSLALREHVPGHLLYANGHRFYPRYYQLHSTQPGSPLASSRLTRRARALDPGSACDSPTLVSRADSSLHSRARPRTLQEHAT